MSSEAQRSDEVTVSWTAQRLRVSNVTVLRYLEEGSIRGYQMKKPRGWWRIDKDSVLAFERRIREGMLS